MLGEKKGVKGLLKDRAINCVFNHCLIHRLVLVSKALPDKLGNCLLLVIEIINYIKNSPLNSRLFTKIWVDLDQEHLTLLWYTEVRWLSKGNMLQRFCELYEPIIEFVTIHNTEL